MTEVSQTGASKLHLLDAPLAHPGTCSSCGSARIDDRQYVDLGYEIDFHGAVYLCTLCCFNFMQLLGFISAEDVEDLKEENKALRTALASIRQKEKLVDDLMGSLFAAGSVYQSSLDLLASDFSGKESDQGDVEVNESAISDDSDIDELAELEGSISLPSNSSSNNNFPGLTL